MYFFQKINQPLDHCIVATQAAEVLIMQILQKSIVQISVDKTLCQAGKQGLHSLMPCLAQIIEKLNDVARTQVSNIFSNQLMDYKYYVYYFLLFI